MGRATRDLTGFVTFDLLENELVLASVVFHILMSFVRIENQAPLGLDAARSRRTLRVISQLGYGIPLLLRNFSTPLANCVEIGSLRYGADLGLRRRMRCRFGTRRRRLFLLLWLQGEFAVTDAENFRCLTRTERTKIAVVCSGVQQSA